MFRTMTAIKPNGTVEVWHLEGELVDVPDRNSPSGFGTYVRTHGLYLYQLTPDWKPTRWEALTRAAEDLDKVADAVIDAVSKLRAEAELAREERRPLPAAGAATTGPGESAAGGRDVTPAAQDRFPPFA